MVTRKDLRLIELATNRDVSWPKCDSPLTSLDVHIENSCIYIQICIYDLILGSILIPSWVLDHSFIYLTFYVLCCTISYYQFRDVLDIIIFRNVILSYFHLKHGLRLYFSKSFSNLFQRLAPTTLTDRAPYSILYDGISRFPSCLVI